MEDSELVIARFVVESVPDTADCGFRQCGAETAATAGVNRTPGFVVELVPNAADRGFGKFGAETAATEGVNRTAGW